MAGKVADNSITTAEGLEVYSDLLLSGVDEYIAINNGIDLTAITQLRWKDLLYFLHDNYIKPRKTELLRVDGNINNQYDVDKVSAVYDIYTRLCAKYEKIVITADFLTLTGIPDETFYRWKRKGSAGFSIKGCEFAEKVKRTNEDSIVSAMISTGRNPVSYIAMLNHYHDWQTTATANGTNESRKNPAEIAAAHGLSLERADSVGLPAPDFVVSSE